MINVLIKFLATMKEITNISELKIDIKYSSTFNDLLDILDEIGYKIKNQILDSKTENISSVVLVMINDSEIATLEGLDTRLKDGDIVSLIPIVHGG